MYLPMQIEEIGKNQDKSMNETSVSFYRLIDTIDITFTNFYRLTIINNIIIYSLVLILFL